MQEASASYLRRLGIVVEETEDLEATMDILRRYNCHFSCLWQFLTCVEKQWQPINYLWYLYFFYLGHSLLLSLKMFLWLKQVLLSLTFKCITLKLHVMVYKTILILVLFYFHILKLLNCSINAAYNRCKYKIMQSSWHLNFPWTQRGLFVRSWFKSLRYSIGCFSYYSTNFLPLVVHT